MATLNSNVPSGPIAQKWDKHKFDLKLVNPANKRKFDIIVVGSGLAGASAAASLAELGYKVRTVRVARIASRRKAELTRRKIIRTMATAFTGCSMTQSRAATIAHAKRMCIGSRR